MRTKPCLTSADAHKMIAACKADVDAVTALRRPSRPRGAVWARSAFRLRGSLGPLQRAGNLFARSAGMPKLHPVRRGVGQME